MMRLQLSVNLPDSYGKSDSSSNVCDDTNSVDNEQQRMTAVCGGQVRGSGKRINTRGRGGAGC